MDAVRTEAVKLWQKMGRLMDSGIPILQVLGICGSECSVKELSQAIEGVREGIKSGVDMSGAMAQYPDYFSQSVVTIVKAGEVTGDLPKSCQTIADSLKDGTFDISTTPEDVSRNSAEVEPDDDESPVRAVSVIIANAILSRASDIHWEWVEGRLRVRYRIDGRLHEANDAPITAKNQDALISRIKIMAGLNVAEKRLPQDGRMQVKVKGVAYDIRTSVVRYHDGESAVMRIYNKNFSLPGLEKQGLTDRNMETLRSWYSKQAGLILVNGPTGCGKTTTIYSMLKQVNTSEVKVVTVEDPIEVDIPGVNQLPIRPVIGLTFAAALRSMLRQDPDVILIGEIRDLETAQIAIQAALTGHLVMATLHAKDGAEAVTRLVEMGLEPFLINSALIGVLSQRLVRTICPECKAESDPPDWVKAAGSDLSQDKSFKGKGCASCNQSGYRGRIAIQELLDLDDNLREIIMHRPGLQELRDHVRANDIASMREDGLAKAASGITTVEEVLRMGV